MPRYTICRYTQGAAGALRLFATVTVLLLRHTYGHAWTCSRWTYSTLFARWHFASGR